MWMTVLKEIWGKYNMKKIPLRLIFLVSLLFFSCSSLEISTVKDPNRDINNLSGFLVFCDVPDIGLRTDVENKIVSFLLKKNKVAKDSISLFPPLREYDDSEIRELCQKNNLDTKIVIRLIDSTSESSLSHSYNYVNGIMVATPISMTVNYYCYDVLIQNSQNEEIIMHSTVNMDESLKYHSSEFAEKIVYEMLNEEYKEYINILKSLFGEELELIPISDNKYTIQGVSKIGDITIGNGLFEIKLPAKFSSIPDEKGIVERVDTENSSYCRIVVNKAQDLSHIVDLLKEFNARKNK